MTAQQAWWAMIFGIGIAMSVLYVVVDNEARWRIADAVAAATTWEQVAEIQAQCEHRYHVGKSECWICGYVKPADPDFLIDDIPYLGMR